MASSLSRLFVLAFLFLCPLPGHTQTSQPPAPSSPSPSSQLLKAEELDQLMAPIALYPDALLANVLMASTYPLEVVEADRWVKANKNLKGEHLKAEADKQRWDDSIKQLAATPSVLDVMSGKLEWTQKLGDAVLAQQTDLMDSVQRLRLRAQAEKKLTTTKEQTVSVKTENNKQVVVIEPANPDTIYVPYYDPATVYGAWPYPAYPPYSYPPYGGYLASGLIGFGVGWAVGAAWGGGFGWGNNNININRGDINVGSGNRWTHRPEHRGGVRYNNSDVAQRFGKGDRAGAQQRMDFRGRDGQQVVKPGGDRAGAGDRERPGGDRAGAGDRKGGDRAGAGDRKSGDRAGAGNRPGGGDRAGQRPSGREGLGNPGQGRSAMAHADRGRASMGGGPGGGPRVGGSPGGGARMGGGGGGGFRGGGGGGARGGGGRRSDMVLKHDIVRLGTLDNGLGLYRFAYVGSDRAYVGVMAQEVQAVMPEAVVKGRDGYLRVRYERLGLPFQTYDQWLSRGARVPVASGAGR